MLRRDIDGLLIYWHDDPKRTLREVLGLVERGTKRAEAEGL
jgi:hypothetical protein